MFGTGLVRACGTVLDLLDDSEFVATLYLGAVAIDGGADGVGSTSILGNADGGTRVGSPGELKVGRHGGHLHFHCIRIRKTPKVQEETGPLGGDKVKASLKWAV